ncbi:hypothetical protein IDJ81_00385 [Tsuneonella flava]|uniref:Uncharacterized protein n=1 Tax=Tsuneonella flava TaxID=2055955 RepID=A0ABX7KDQ9_9SPHN|nr:hypothetical protein [Tsuneonella flava]QSB44695.1 hypothetical protein IDJ81_00385 [Tsuneonella flava]
MTVFNGMTKTPNPLACAPVAIAMAALLPAAAMAQDATSTSPPVIVLDSASVGSQSQRDTVTLPGIASAPQQPVTSAPVDMPMASPVEAAPVQQARTAPASAVSAPKAANEASVPEAANETTGQRSVATPRQAPTAPAAGASANTVRDASAVPSEGDAATSDNAAGSVAGGAAMEMTGDVAAPLAADVAPDPAQQPDRGEGIPFEILIALLAAGGIGAGTYLLLRSRSRRRAPALATAAPVRPRQPAPSAAEPAFDREPQVTALDAPVQAASASRTASQPTAFAGTYAPYRSEPATDRGAVPLPDELPQTFEERDALLQRMIAAAPDRANPFRSPRARARRARLILQSLGRRFEKAKPRIDLRQYAYHWPALRGWKPASA